jgi:hypothetical protein
MTFDGMTFVGITLEVIANVTMIFFRMAFV